MPRLRAKRVSGASIIGGSGTWRGPFDLFAVRYTLDREPEKLCVELVDAGDRDEAVLAIEAIHPDALILDVRRVGSAAVDAPTHPPARFIGGRFHADTLLEDRDPS